MISLTDCKYNSIGKPWYDRRLAQMALDFATRTYTISEDAHLDISSMEQEGFVDISCVYDCSVVDESITDAPEVRRAHLAEGKGTTRAAVGVRPTRLSGKSGIVVCIAFNGTVYDEDWLINFQVLKNGEKHAGFDRNTREFAAIDNKILFHSIKKSLQDILLEAGSGNESYRFFILGHSMGAALAQLYIAEFLMGKYSIPSSLISGYTFASPCPVDKNYTDTPEKYPIFNIINTDDPVPKTGPLSSVIMGTKRHLGKELFYTPDDAFRKKSYFRSQKFEQKESAHPILKIRSFISDAHELLDSYKNIVEGHLIQYAPKENDTPCAVTGENLCGSAVVEKDSAIYFCGRTLSKLHNGEISPIAPHQGISLLTAGDYLYYINCADAHPYRILPGGQPEELYIREIPWLYLDGCYLYYKDFCSGKLYRLRADGAGMEEPLPKEQYYDFKVHGDKIYYIDADDKMVYQVNINGTEKECLFPHPTFQLQLSGSFLYVAGRNGIWRLDLRKQTDKQMVEAMCGNFLLAGEHLFYTDEQDGFALYCLTGETNYTRRLQDGWCYLLGHTAGKTYVKAYTGEYKTVFSYDAGTLDRQTALAPGLL